MQPAVSRIVAHLLHDPALTGYRVAIIGDFHIAPWRSTAALRHAVNVINRSEPDLVALVGDYGYSVDHLTGFSRALYRAVMPRILPELSRLSARHGTCAVLGNHDLDAGGDDVARALSAAGIRVLRDSHHDIPHNGGCLRVIGFDDIIRSHRTASSINVAGASALLIVSHHPDFVLRCSGVPRSCPAVVVSGHTHGGQIVFPWLGAPMTLSRVATRWFPAGFVPNEYVGLYVTRGLGEQIPLRTLADREITLLELALR